MALTAERALELTKGNKFNAAVVHVCVHHPDLEALAGSLPKELPKVGLICTCKLFQSGADWTREVLMRSPYELVEGVREAVEKAATGGMPESG